MEALFNKTIIERRSKARYPVQLTVRYRTVGRNQLVNGVGQTLNMSSGGLLVSAQHEFSAGLKLEVNVEWPLLLNGRVPLQLVANGKIVRCGGSITANSDRCDHSTKPAAARIRSNASAKTICRARMTTIPAVTTRTLS